MLNAWKPTLCAAAVLGMCGWSAAFGQTAGGAAESNGQFEALSPVPSRVVEPIDETKLVTLKGNTHPLARPEFDRGPVDGQLPLERMQLVLQRSPEQEAALDRFMAEQYDPQSANFHRWMEPEEFGRLYGPSDADIAAVTSWMENHGFRIYLVSKGRVTIEFSGTAERVRETFHTEIHRYLVNGVEHIANDRDPQIPRALAPVVAGIASLHNFFPRHQSEFGRFVKRDRKTGKITPVDRDSEAPIAQLTYTDSNNKVHEDISPFDFAAIYNLLPLWKAGIDGAGEKIAISAVSDIEQSDIDTFRSSFGLPSSTIDVMHNGTDPGIVSGATVENTLDTEWSGAAAPEATIVLVVSESQATTFGGQLSDSYIVDNKVTPVMSASYGGCEFELGASGNAAFNGIYKQGAAEGISIFESAGDQGSTGCDETGGAADTPAKNGLQVNGLASSPYVTAVGGTDFDYYASDLSTYWNASNAATGATAKGYIPEVPWDSTCTSSWLLAGSPSFDSSEAICAYASYTPAVFGLDRVAGGSGGVSACTAPTGTAYSDCAGGYAKPAWQAGVGVPADGKRDLPDVSLFAADGFPDGIVGTAFLMCVAANDPEGCDYSNPTYIIYQEVGGTSVSSPAMAGIMALVLQKQGGKAQGLANPVLYKLAAKENVGDCNSNSVKNGNGCVFYDITAGTNAQVCVYASLNCYTPSGYAIGIVTGYNSTYGYDLATGLGSVNANNLVNSWSSAIAPVGSLTPGKLAFPSTKVGSSSKAMVVTLENTGVSALKLSSGGITIGGADPGSFAKTTTCASALADNATCTISVTFKPTKTGALSATLEVADNASGSPQKVALTGTGASGASLSLSPSTLSFPDTALGATSDVQAVTVENESSAAVKLSSISIAGANKASFVEVNDCGASLSVGASCSVFVAFRPAAAGRLSATLSVADNAAGSPQTVALSGVGTAEPSVTLSKTSLTFASTAKGATSEEQSVTLTNAGASAVELTGFAVTGTDASSFAALNDCPATLAPAANCAVYVAFVPQSTGSLTASLTVADTGKGSPQTVKLAGTGAP
jgi:hypothetical protein